MRNNKTAADANRSVCDQFLGDVITENPAIEVRTIGLTIRQIVCADQAALENAMQYLSGSFEFRAETLFVNNAFAYEIHLPAFIVDAGPE